MKHKAELEEKEKKTREEATKEKIKI